MTGIVIDNIGPIEHLELDAKPGTVTVLRGMNGEGKSTALEAISAITRGSSKLESRDGTTGGTAAGFGVQIKVGRGGSNRRTGDLVVTAVEDRLSIAEFVEPNIKNPVAADARRLKALVSLAGVAADPAVFHGVVGGEAAFVEIVKPETLRATDPIELAEAIKRDFEAAARLCTTRAERLYGEIKAKVESNKDLDLDQEHDAGVLQRRLEMALADKTAIETRASLAIEDESRRRMAAERLVQAKATQSGRVAERARKDLEKRTSELQGLEADAAKLETSIRGLEEKLAAAQRDMRAKSSQIETARQAVKSASKAVDAAVEHEKTLAQWQEEIDKPAVEAPSEEAVSAARRAVDVARQQHERGVLIRAGVERQAQAEGLERERVAAVKRAEFLRDAAQSVLDVLAEQVKGLIPGLKLTPELRIVVPHRKRTTCFYADLSHGERWTMALDIAVAAFTRRGEKGVLAIPQEAWEGLDGRNRKVIADHVAKTDLIVFTAEADRAIDGGTGIDVEVMQGAKA